MLGLHQLFWAWFFASFHMLLLSPGVRVEADPSVFYPGTQKVHVLTWKQDYYQVAFTNVGMVPRRLRSWKDLKNLLGVLSVIYLPAGELEKMSNKQRLPTTWYQSGSCWATATPQAMGGTDSGLYTLSGRPQEQKGNSVCRQGKELHSKQLWKHCTF